MLTNSMVRKISEIKKENRRLKSKQTILGSTVATASSAIGSIVIKIARGTPLNAVIIGSLTAQLEGLDGASINSAPMMAFNVLASTSANIIVGYNDLQQYPAQGGLSFNWAPASITDKGVAVINFILTLNYDIATKGGNIYLQIFASGPALLKSVEEQHRVLVN